MAQKPRTIRSLLFAAGLAAAASPSFGGLAQAAPSAAATQKVCLVAAEQGQQLRNAGRLLDARGKFLTCQASVCPTIVRDDCIRWLGEVVDATPTVIVSIKDETGADIFDAKVFVDDKPLAIELLGRPLHLDPGRHTVRATRGEIAKESQVLVAQGTKQRTVEIVLASPPPAPPPPVKTDPPPPPPLPPIVKLPPPPPPPPPPLFGPQRYASIGVAGLGAIGLLGGAIIGAGYNSSIATLREGCGRTSSCAQADVDALKGDRTTAYVLTGIGATLLVTGAVLFVTGRPHRVESVDGRHARVAPAVVPVRGGAFAALEGTF